MTPQQCARDYVKGIETQEFYRLIEFMRKDLTMPGRMTQFEIEAFIETLTGVRFGWK